MPVGMAAVKLEREASGPAGNRGKLRRVAQRRSPLEEVEKNWMFGMVVAEMHFATAFPAAGRHLYHQQVVAEVVGNYFAQVGIDFAGRDRTFENGRSWAAAGHRSAEL